jgi:hypothetical protein
MARPLRRAEPVLLQETANDCLGNRMGVHVVLAAADLIL